MVKLLLLMLLAHIIDDFVLQPVCLSKLKQKEWWAKQEGYSHLYKNDYKMALLMHSMSWSIMILLPAMFLIEVSELLLGSLFLINTLGHFLVDNEKANYKTINLTNDQAIHILQILGTWAAMGCGLIT